MRGRQGTVTWYHENNRREHPHNDGHLNLIEPERSCSSLTGVPRSLVSV